MLEFPKPPANPDEPQPVPPCFFARPKPPPKVAPPSPPQAAAEPASVEGAGSAKETDSTSASASAAASLASLLSTASGADNLSHEGHYASACASSVRGAYPGVLPFGADNLLRATASWARPADADKRPPAAANAPNGLVTISGGDKYKAVCALEAPVRARFATAMIMNGHRLSVSDVSIVSPLSLLNVFCLLFASISPFSCAVSPCPVSPLPWFPLPCVLQVTEHRIKHVMKPAVFAKEPTFEQAAASELDPSPSVYVCLPVGCLLEEVHVIDGWPPSASTGGGIGGASSGSSRLGRLRLQIFHLDQTEIRERSVGCYDTAFGGDPKKRPVSSAAAFPALEKVTRASQPVWEGGLQESGAAAGVANLKRWAASKTAQAMQASERTFEQVGGCYYGSGASGLAQVHLPGGADRRVTGVIGNVIRLSWRPASELPSRGSLSEELTPLAIGGVVLVGRRVREPLWRGLSWLQRAVASKRDEEKASSKVGSHAFLDLVQQAKF